MTSMKLIEDDLVAVRLPLMNAIRGMGRFCDVTLKVEDQTFSAHRIVLAATVPYFYEMFISDVADSRTKEITMKDIDPAVLESLINYAYTGQIGIDNKNVQSIMKGASYLQLLKLQNACEHFLISHLQPQDVLGIRHLADSMSCADLIKAADKYILENFTEVSQSEEFLNLDFETLVEIIKSDDLNVNTEEIVFDACIKWVKFSEDERLPKLPEVLGQVRLPLLSPQVLVDRVAREEIVRSSHQCRDLIDEANNFHLLPERRHSFQSYRTRQRLSFIREKIYIVGKNCGTVEIFDPLKQIWRKVANRLVFKPNFGLVTIERKLFAFGELSGAKDISTVTVYDHKKNIWTGRRTLDFKFRSGIGIAAFKERIYMCGGFGGRNGLNTVECYCPNTNICSTVASMIDGRSYSSVAVLNNFMYVLGGHNNNGCVLNSVERYDPISYVWDNVQPMLQPRYGLGVAVLNGKIYACGGHNGKSFLRSVEVYDPIKNSWSLVNPMICERSGLGLVASVGKLWAIGGCAAETMTSVEVYDPKTDTWKLATNMPTIIGGVCAVVIDDK